MREIFQNSLLVENVDMASSFPYVVFLKQYFQNSFKAFTPKQLLFFFKQSDRAFLFWKLSSIRTKRFYLLEICWKTRWQKVRKVLKPISKSSELFGVDYSVTETITTVCIVE